MMKEYEEAKKELVEKNLTPEEYENEIRKIAEKLNV